MQEEIVEEKQTKTILFIGHENRLALPKELLAVYLKYFNYDWVFLKRTHGFIKQLKLFCEEYKKSYIEVDSFSFRKTDLIVTCYDGRVRGEEVAILVKAIKKEKEIINLMFKPIKFDTRQLIWTKE